MISNSSHSHAPLRSWKASAIGAATLLFASLSVPLAPAAGAAPGVGTGGFYNMQVASSGLAININNPSFPLQPDLPLDAYAASAALDSLGRSTAKAAAPDLGTFLGPLPGTFNGLGSGQVPPFPPTPGEVRSSFPGQPSAGESNGGYSIQAESTERESTAAVNLGSATPGAENATFFSLAQALAERNGALKAVGSAGADLLNIGGVLDIGRVSSIITMNQSGSGAPKYVTATDVGTITVSGQKFGLNQDGLTAAGTSSGSSAEQVNEGAEALKQAGLSIRFLPATVTTVPGTKTVESVQSGVVEVTSQQEVPSQGLVTTTYTFGQVKLSATSGGGTSNVARTAHGNSTASEASSGNAAAPRLSPSAPEIAPGQATAGGNVAVPAASLGTAPVAQPHEQRTEADDGQSVAIITPTLKILRFGSVLGLPNGCNIFAGVLGAGAAELEAGSAGPALSQGVDQCTAIGNAGGEQISAAIPQLAPLAAINPAFDPGIEAFAAALESIGRDQAEAVSPFGPTIAGLAAGARFFKGCEEAC